MAYQKVQLDFKNLIKCALDHEISWPALKVVLDSATTTLQKSKKLIHILLEEMESIQTKLDGNKTLSQYNGDQNHDGDVSSAKIEVEEFEIDHDIENNDDQEDFHVQPIDFYERENPEHDEVSIIEELSVSDDFEFSDSPEFLEELQSTEEYERELIYIPI